MQNQAFKIKISESDEDKAPPSKSISHGLKAVVSERYLPRFILDNNGMSWFVQQIQILFRLLLKLGIQDLLLIDKIERLDDLVRQHWRPNGTNKIDPEEFFKSVAAFMPELHEMGLFTVQKHLSYDKKENNIRFNEVLAAFLDFLIQVLDCEQGFHMLSEDGLTNLLKELKFLLAVLGDAPFRDCTNNNFSVFVQFENVVNEAGKLVYSLFFTSDPDFKISADEVLVMVQVMEQATTWMEEKNIKKPKRGAAGLMLQLIDQHTNAPTLLKLKEKINRVESAVCNFLMLIEQLKVEISHHVVGFSNDPGSFVANREADDNNLVITLDSLFIVDSLLQDLEGLMANQEAGLDKNLELLSRNLHDELMNVRSVICEGNYELSENEEVKETLKQIINTAYEVEYLINSFEIGDVPLWYLSLRLPRVLWKMKLVGQRLGVMIKKNYNMAGVIKHLVSEEEDLSISTLRGAPPQSTSVDDVIVGFEIEATAIRDRIVGGRGQLQMISILGMPGSGKSTLAMKLYGDPLIHYRFPKRAWCVVSQTYKMKNVLSDVLKSLEIKPEGEGILDDKSLTLRIYQTLKGRRYLVVIDDIWDVNVWDDLNTCFPDDGNGSRILFTSRMKDAVPSDSIIRTVPTLSDDQCWELLEKKAFRQESCPIQLLSIGKKIASNCQGLPLAVVVVAGVLSMDRDESMWQRVEASSNTYIFDEPNNCMNILELSYKYLPDHLKPCFLYFGAFPEDAQIPVRKLILLWIAEGFIKKEEEKSLEDVAKEYLMELINKSLVQISRVASRGGPKACRIHDLLRDLCLRRSKDENFLKVMEEGQSSLYEKHHRLCVPLSLSSSLLLPFGVHVRSLLWYNRMKSLCFRNMKLLRVLDISGMSLADKDGLEKIFQYLVLLRLLATNVMPDNSIGNLVNLEIFLLQGYFEKCTITPIIMKLNKLRILSVKFKARFDENCDSSLVNHNVQYLSSICVYNLKDEEMLRSCFPNLRKLKCKCKPLMVVENQETYNRYPNLRSLTQLESLKIVFKKRSASSENVVEIISPELMFPSNIAKLTLSEVALPWEKMSIIGMLPKLEVLKLASDAFVGETWETNDGEFQELRILKLEELKFGQWNASSDHFPKLERVLVRLCENLEEIPEDLGDILTLEKIEIQHCKNSVVDSVVRMLRQQKDMGNEQLEVFVAGDYYGDARLV